MHLLRHRLGHFFWIFALQGIAMEAELMTIMTNDFVYDSKHLISD
jgi:hypothetical protein